MELEVCPYCGNRSLESRGDEREIPFFGKVLMLTYLCSKCGYRHSDVMCLEDHGPSKQVIKVLRAEDLKIKVARSDTATMEIPELGLRMDPGPQSQAFITNIDGILSRFEDAVERLVALDEPAKKKNQDELLQKIKLAKQGKLAFTVILEDPRGNTIIAENYDVC